MGTTQGWPGQSRAGTEGRLGAQSWVCVDTGGSISIAGAFRLAWVLLLEERPGSVGMDGCAHVPRDGVGGPGGHWSIVCSRVQMARGCLARGLPDGHVLGAGHAVWTCLGAQPLVGML